MSEEYYDKEAKANLISWEENILAGQDLRKMFPPQLLLHSGTNTCRGYYDYCNACGTKLFAEFGDFSMPLAEQFVPCPISNEKGHGIFASAINIVLN